jgi:hypothetical protein
LNCNVTAGGGTARNSFGLAVQAIVGGPSSTPFWSPQLAAADSDGDGFSNGTELGDPDGDFQNLGPASLVSLPGSATSVPPVSNNPPVITPVGDQSVDEGMVLAFTVSATDPNAGQVLTFSLGANAPAGATVNSSDGAFTWTPTEDQGPGDYSISVIVIDNGSPVASATNTFNVAVAEVNSAPVIAPVEDQTVPAGTTVTFTAVASDFDVPAQSLSYLLGAAPAGAAISPDAGLFTWAVAADQQPGTNVIEVIATDDGVPSLSATNIVLITVTSGGAVGPTLLQPGIVQGDFTCAVATSAGSTYFLEFSPGIPVAEWITVAQADGDGTTLTLQDTNAPAGAGYYRVRVE